MVIDKSMNLDQELEYFKDGGLAFAQNVVVGPDGLTIQNEPAIVNFISDMKIDLVGFIACNEEFVLFGLETIEGQEERQSVIYRIKKDNNTPIKYKTNWKWQGGEVFGTFSYNVANELIIAISERNPTSDCPLKVINLDREGYLENSDDNIYTLTPNIPKANVIDIGYVLGNRIKKGKYNFFIKYYIGDNFETAWFPIGVPVFAYDNIEANQLKTIDKETIQAVGELDDVGVPKELAAYNILYEDFYNEDVDYTNNNIKLKLEINDTINFTHYRIGYIVNSNTGTEGYQTNKFLTKNDKNSFVVVIGNYAEPVSVDELTISAFNLYNVNTMCNYKDRLYLANYKEENRNKSINDIDVSNIRVLYSLNDVSTVEETSAQTRASINDEELENDDKPDEDFSGGGGSGGGGTITDDTDSFDNYNARRREWISKPGRCAVYNFFIHYVYSNGNYTDGIKIGAYKGTEAIPSGFAALETVTNSKGDVLFKTQQTTAFNANKLYFIGIKMYPQFVGYFISYEKPEYIQIGEGFLIPASLNRSSTESSDFFHVRDRAISSQNWKFYYPEFSIVGGKTTINRFINTGIHQIADTKFVINNARRDCKGFALSKNDFTGNGNVYDVDSTVIKSPNSYENVGKEGYLRVNFTNNIEINQQVTESNPAGFMTFTGIRDTSDLYLADDKQLVSLGYIKYVDYNKTNLSANENLTYGYELVPYNYDFYRCFSSIIFFHKDGVIINQTESNHINVKTGDEFYPTTPPVDNKTYPHIGIIKYWHETHYPLFLKELNQAPETVFYSYYKQYGVTEGEELNKKSAEQYQRKALVLNPQYINDLYKLDPIYYDYTGKLLVNYDKKLVSNQLETYNKTIRRSDVIQSESIVNSWRFFRPENYKIITEDKGAINNIVGIGNYLFAHCEHSLFLFDVSDSLQALDKNVQLLQPDSFEVAYKEVFTADKGYGGIQDHESWICDEFGYIFFDKSAKKIYRFDGGQLKDMTEGIIEFIKTVNPEHIWFGNDRERNRIMTNIRSTDENIMLSYNLLGGAWSSTHSYIANYKFIGLKDKLFIPNVVGNKLTITHYIDTEFNKFTLPVGNIDNDDSFKSFIDVVFTNPNYNKIKVLDFITYILNKEPADNFELLQLEIYTNCCYSGKIDISQERKKVAEYKKPYYDFERWNFNCFRNVIDKIENGDIVHRMSGRIHNYPQKVQRGYDNALISGKYVVIRFSFKLMSKQVNIKDIHAYFKP